MLPRFRSRLTYSNVMSTIAVFAAVAGGTAWAASKIGTNQIKNAAVTAKKLHKNAVTTNKIKNDAVTGAKAKESSFGQVPDAAHADNADNSATLGGSAPSAFAGVASFHRHDPSPTGGLEPVLSKGGLTVQYRCSGDEIDQTPVMVATSSVDHALITLGFTSGSKPSGSSWSDSDQDFNPGDSFSLTQGFDFGEGTAVYTTPGGTVVNLNYGFQGNPCDANGIAIQG